MEPINHYTSASHADSVMASVNKMRLDEDLCDVVIVVGNIRMQAHGIILAASAPLFYQMTKACVGSLSVPEYKLEDVDETAALKVIEFCYTSTISINEEDLWSIFVAATKLGCQEIIDFCCELLTSSLDLATCVHTHLMATALNSDNLMMTTAKFVAENIDRLCASDTFLCLTPREILDLLASLQLKDEQLLRLTSTWLDHDVQGRMKIALQLMEDFPSVSDNLQQQYLVSDLHSHNPQLHNPQLHNPQLHNPQLHNPQLHNPQLHNSQSVIVRGKDDSHSPLQLSLGRSSESEGSISAHSQQQLLREVPLYICISCGEAFDSQAQLGQHVDECGESVHARTCTKDKKVMQSEVILNLSSEDVAMSCDHLVSKSQLGRSRVKLFNQKYNKGDKVQMKHSQMAKQSETSNQHETGSEILHSGKHHFPHALEKKHPAEIICQKQQRLSRGFTSSSDAIENQCQFSVEEKISSTCFTRIMQFGSVVGVTDNNMNNSSSCRNVKTGTQTWHKLAQRVGGVNQECEPEIGQVYRDGTMKSTAENYPELKAKVDRYRWKNVFSRAKLQNVLPSRRKCPKLKCLICNWAFSERMMLANHMKLVHGVVENMSSEDTMSDGHDATHEYRNTQRKDSMLTNINERSKENAELDNSSDRQYHLAGSRDSTGYKNLSIPAQSCPRQCSDFTDWYLELGHEFCQICAAYPVKDSPCPHTMVACKHDQNEIDKIGLGIQTDCEKNTAMDIAEGPLDMSKDSQKFYAEIDSSLSKSNHAPLDLSKCYTNHSHSESARVNYHSNIPHQELELPELSKKVTSEILYNLCPLTDSVRALSSDFTMYKTVVGERETTGSENDVTSNSSGNHVYSLAKKKNISSQQSFSCTVCKKVFTYQAALLTHMQTHSLSACAYQCQLCKQSFVNGPDHEVHICHNGIEKPYACPNCDQMFAKNIHLKRHLATHSGLKPYPCWVCGKRFSRSDHLKRHTQSLHAGSRPHGCLICGKEFVRKYELNKHMIVHSQDANGNLITPPFPIP